MATVQTLKDKDNNTFYPVTKTEAVYNADGTKTLDYILDHTIIASENPADANKVFKADASLGLVGANNIDFTTMESSSGLTRRCDFGSLHIFTTVTSTSEIGQTQIAAALPSDFAPAGRIVFASCTPHYNASGLNQTYSLWWQDGYIYAYVNNLAGTNEYGFIVVAYF